MNKDKCYYLGRVARMHGYKGEVNFYLDVDDPYQYKNLESVLVEIDEKLVPFFIDEIRITQKNHALVKLKGVNHYDQANVLVGKSLYLPLKMLPDLGSSDFYVHEIIGYTLVDDVKGELGKINDVFDYPANRLLQVFHNGKELLLPLSDESFVSIDKQKQILTIHTVEGLIDLYLTDDHSEED